MENHQITTVVRVGDWNYLVDPTPIGPPQEVASALYHSSSLIPVTILSLDPDVKKIDHSTIEETLASYLNADDVISEGFFSSLIIFVEKESGQVLNVEANSKYSNVRVQVRRDTDETLRGPYFLIGEKLHRVYRLFPDTYGAFVSGVLLASPESKDGFQEPPHIQGIPVPSRLYFSERTASQPLLGERIVVKDIYDVCGLKTGGGSKAYLSLQEKAVKTADAIQLLIDLGAVIIGKTMTSHMISGVSARDWIDYQCPFNPRGDGYLSPDCSSSGSGAAIVGYNWVDCAIGSDSLGSMVGPASHGGSYGLRPTHGLLSNRGALAVSAVLDTPGHFARDLETFSTVANHWLPKSVQRSTEKVKRILVLKERFRDFPDTEVSVMYRFLADVASVLNIPTQDLDIETFWNETSRPEENLDESQSLKDYLSTTLATIQLYDSYHNNFAFQEQHKQAFGHEPPIDEIVRYKWNLGSKITKEEHDAALKQRDVFKTFLEDRIVQEGTLLILPGGMPFVQYRDEYPGDLEASGKPWQGYGFTSTAFSSLGGLPCISFPVGQSTYVSKITNVKEQKPVSLWMLSAPGTDNWLIDVLTQITKGAGRPTSVKVGKTAF